MANTPIPPVGFTSLGTTTVETAFQPKGSRAAIFIGDIAGVDRDEGIELNANDVLIVGPGLAVSATAFSSGVVMSQQPLTA